jgi:TnpA family transposase
MGTDAIAICGGEMEERLNVVEAWNRANAVISYGRGGETSTNRCDEVEMTARCPRILPASSLSPLNVLTLRDVLTGSAGSRPR